jgi:uracil-DNA glycosylase family 4
MKPLSQEWLAELNLSPQWRERTPVAQAPSPAAEPAGHYADSDPGLAAAPERYAYSSGSMIEVAQMDWPQLKQSVATCTLCPLHEKRTQAVFGVGDEQADCLFVGEAPGAEEDAQGEPFVGQAGKLLDNMLASISMNRSERIYIANVVKCRPPGNRNPEPLEAAACAPFLDRQIDLIAPKLIVALGKVAAVRLLGREASIASLRGQVLNYRGRPLIVTYHPAYLLRSLMDKAKAWEDLCFIQRTMQGLQNAEPSPI